MDLSLPCAQNPETSNLNPQVRQGKQEAEPGVRATAAPILRGVIHRLWDPS